MNHLEDFHHDERFRDFLHHYCEPPYDACEIELIFNGDMLNLIQTDYRGHYPSVVTESISAEKVKLVISGHPEFFRALKDFLANPKHTMTYIVGNHDQEMYWKTSRALLEEAVGREITWKNFYHLVDGVHVEHGHQYEAINRVDPARPFLTEGLPEPILNLPWGTLFTVQYLVRVKMSRPYIDKVRPFRFVLWWALFHDTWAALSHLFRLVSYFLATRLSHSRYRDTTWRATWKILREASIFPDLTGAARRILQTPEIHTVVFGHSHVYKQVQLGHQKQYINTGTWTDIVSMDLASYGRRTKLTYVRIEYDENDNARPYLRHWIGKIPLEDDALGL